MLGVAETTDDPKDIMDPVEGDNGFKFPLLFEGDHGFESHLPVEGECGFESQHPMEESLKVHI